MHIRSGTAVATIVSFATHPLWNGTQARHDCSKALPHPGSLPHCALTADVWFGPPVAVVGCTEDSHHLLFMLPQEAFTDQLMCPDNEAQPVYMVEVFTNVLHYQTKVVSPAVLV